MQEAFEGESDMKKKEIQRFENRFKDEPWEKLNCIRCGKEFTLWFNGGELDMTSCCNLTYMGEHKQVDIVVYDRE